MTNSFVVDVTSKISGLMTLIMQPIRIITTTTRMSKRNLFIRLRCTFFKVTLQNKLSMATFHELTKVSKEGNVLSKRLNRKSIKIK